MLHLASGECPAALMNQVDDDSILPIAGFDELVEFVSSFFVKKLTTTQFYLFNQVSPLVLEGQ